MSHIETLIERYPVLLQCRGDIEKACAKIIKTFVNNGTLLVCGNGGSCGDAEHIAGELMKGFHKKRPLSPEQKQSLISVSDDIGANLAETLQQPLRTISLMGMPALSTAFANDARSEYTFAQMALAYSCKNSTLLGISTSGNAENVLAAAVVVKSMGACTIGLTGAGGGKMKGIFDIIIKVPETETYKVQELHLPVYHAICLTVEEHFFDE
jgi:D-sedoheptulose 7-phosphate isomerase